MEMQSRLNEEALPFKVCEALQYIKKNYNRKNLHVKEIISHVNMREDSFSHLWHHTMKISISDFINDLRLNAAEALLCNGFFIHIPNSVQCGLYASLFLEAL